MPMGFITIMVQSITVIVTKNIIGMVASIIINTMVGITDMIITTVDTTDMVIIHISIIIDHISILILVGISAILVMDTGVVDASRRVNIRIHSDITGKMWFGCELNCELNYQNRGLITLPFPLFIFLSQGL